MAQHGIPAAGQGLAHHAVHVRRHRRLRGRAEVHAERLGRRVVRMVVDDVVGGAHRGRQVVRPAPGDEGADGLAQPCRITAMLDGGDGHVFALDDVDRMGLGLGRHVLAPERAQRLQIGGPGRPLRRCAEGRRRLARLPSERTGERLRSLIPACQRDIGDARIVPIGELVRRALEPQQLHVARHANTEQQRELPVEVVRRARRHVRQPRHVQRLVEVRVDMREDVAQAGEIAVGGGGQRRGSWVAIR
ncbi:hypothetical protein RSUY_31140 [Ralstonia solanacearum]|nr:hypothetical protein RSUY_31140 [Ralstonia solanacearum]